MNAVPEAHPDWVKPDLARVETLKTRALEVAFELVASRGPDGVNVRDIAEVLQTGPSSLYYYFKSKDALLAEVAAEGFRRLEAKVRTSVVDAEHGPIRAFGGAYLQFIRENQMLYRVMYAEHILGCYAVTQAAEARARDTFVHSIATGTEAGETEEGALALWAFGRGIAALAIASEATDPGSGRDLTRKLVRGLEALMGRSIRPPA
jgi:AcrR family transcriptional regulator